MWVGLCSAAFFILISTGNCVLYYSRSEMVDGMSLLDLGCGWGSVALHFAGKFKNSRYYIF